MVVPTYWTFASDQSSSKHEPLAVYDHPTSLAASGTLPRLLGSLERLRDKGIEVPNLVVLVAATHKELEKKAKERTEYIVKGYRDKLKILSISSSDLDSIVSLLRRRVLPEFQVYLSLVGYSSIRNVGLFVAQILGSDDVVFLDDDEVVIDDDFFKKCTEFVGRRHGKRVIGGVTGYYINSSGSFWLKDDPREWWKTGWRKKRKMNEAFAIIKDNTRLKETSFAFGGLMVLHKDLFEKVPFDPYISRGEDMDLLVNARIFDFAFLLDNHLRILHAPDYTADRWAEMRQDIYRFEYMRRKLLHLKNMGRMIAIDAESLDPYPGYFLRRDLMLKFIASSLLSAIHSCFEAKVRDAKEYLRNIGLSLTRVQCSVQRHYRDYFVFQRRWAESIPLVRDVELLRNRLENQM